MKRCPSCGLSRALARFEPRAWCGNRGRLHTLCQPCQSHQHNLWSKRLAWFFKRTVLNVGVRG